MLIVVMLIKKKGLLQFIKMRIEKSKPEVAEAFLFVFILFITSTTCLLRRKMVWL